MAKILIVDDDATFRETVQDLLSEDGYETVVAENGAVAIQTFNNVSPDLIILDMLMPKMGGFDCAEALRQTPLGAKVPMIFVSGAYKSPKMVADAQERFRCTEYLIKPFDADALTRAVIEALGEQAGEVEIAQPAEALPEAGTLLEHSVTRLLLRVVADKHTGILDIYGDTLRARLFFLRGHAAMAQSSNPDHNLGMILLKMGHLSPFDYKALLEHVENEAVGLYQAIKDLKVAEDTTIKESYRKLIPEIIASTVALTGQFKYYATDAFMRLIPTTGIPIMPAVYAGLQTAPAILLEAHLEPRKRLRLNKGVHWQEGKKHLSEGLRAYEVLKSVNGRARIAQIYGAASDPGKRRSRMAQIFLMIAADALAMTEEIVAVEPSMVAEVPQQIGAQDSVEIDEAKFTQAPQSPAPGASTAHGAFDYDVDADMREDAALQFSPEEQQAREKIVATFLRLREQNHYQVLGLEREGFDPTAAKKNYFQLAREFHSDSYSGIKLGSATHKLETVFACISEAYEILSNEDKRKEYNAALELSADGTTTDVAKIFEAESLMDKARIVSDRGDFTSAARYLQEAVGLYQSPAIEVWTAYCVWRAAGNPLGDAPAVIQRIEAVIKNARVERAYEFCGIVSRFIDDLPRARKYLLKARAEDGKTPIVERELRMIAKRMQEAEKKGGLSKLFK